MNGAVPGVRAVIVQHKVVGAGDLREAFHRAFDLPRHLRVAALAEQLGDRIPQHLDARLDDHQRDDRAEPGFQGDLEEEEDDCRDQRGRRNDGIQRGVLTGIHQGIGIHLFADAFDIAAQQNFDHHGDGYDDQRNRVVLRRFGMDDLPVHPHFVAVLHLSAHFGDGDAVHLHLPGGDHLLCLAAARHPAQGHVFL